MKHFLLTSIMVFTTLLICNAQNDNSKTLYGYEKNQVSNAYGLLETVHSNAMNRELPVLVFLPDSYKKTTEASPVVYLLHGSGGQPLDDPLLEKDLRKANNSGVRIQEAANFYSVIIVAPLVGNTYYLDAPQKPEIRFATYVGEELPAYIDSKYNTITSREGRFLAGFSMGGYGAVSLLCRYPDNFSVALSRSGVMNLATGIEDLDWDDPTENINIMLGDYWTSKKNWHQNSCFSLINHIRDRDDIAVVIEVGVDDFLYKTNKQFKERMDELGIPNIYSEYQGGHYWNANALNSLLAQLQFFQKTIK